MPACLLSAGVLQDASNDTLHTTLPTVLPRTKDGTTVERDHAEQRAMGQRDARGGAPPTPRVAWTALVEHRFAWLALWDSLSWVLAIWAATWVRYEFDVGSIDTAGVWTIVPVVIAVQVLVGLWQGLYLGRWRLGSFEEIEALLKAVVLSADRKSVV